jgi:tetratricopeptide (TPR) repeat protein
LMKCDPTDAASPFNLGNMLRANGRKVEAEAALRAATRADPTFAEAWYNLSDLLDEQGRAGAAIECLRKALQAAPDYSDGRQGARPAGLSRVAERITRWADVRCAPESGPYSGQSGWPLDELVKRLIQSQRAASVL